MLKLSAKILISGTALVMLSGCQSVLTKIGFQGSHSVDSSAMASASDGTRLELGLAALRNGSPGNAIYHFERAVLDPSAAADAFNGMGVAYAQLGRIDLAERFFTTAIMIEPSDARFARNLQRLQQADEARTTQLAAVDEEGTSSVVQAGSISDQDEHSFFQSSADFVRQGVISIDQRRAARNRGTEREILIGGASSTSSNSANVAIAVNFDKQDPCLVPNQRPEEDPVATELASLENTLDTANPGEYPIRVPIRTTRASSQANN